MDLDISSIRGFPYEGSNLKFEFHLNPIFFHQNSIENIHSVLSKSKLTYIKVLMESLRWSSPKFA